MKETHSALAALSLQFSFEAVQGVLGNSRDSPFEWPAPCYSIQSRRHYPIVKSRFVSI